MAYRKSKKASLKGSVGLFLFALLVFMTVRWAFVVPVVIPSGSMIPNMLIHDHIFVNKMAYGLRWPFTQKWISSVVVPERGDVVIFRSIERDDMYMVKRVIGLPGERVEIKANGNIFINGQALPRYRVKVAQKGEIGALTHEDLNIEVEEADFFAEKLDGKEVLTLYDTQVMTYDWPSLIVPEDSLFLLGDNRQRSRDSRYWGTLPLQQLVGKALFVWLSCQKTLPAATFLCDPTTLRWKRFFHAIK